MPWMVLGGGLGEGVRLSPVRHLGAPGEIIEGEQRPENASHSLVAAHKGGLADKVKLCLERGE